MDKDVFVEGLNISALLRNFDKLRGTVKAQGEIVRRQQEEIKVLKGLPPAYPRGVKRPAADSDFMKIMEKFL